MIIKGRTRGGGRQLASYLLTAGENEHIEILDVDGRQKFTERDFRDLLGDFSLTEKLSRSRKGLYHATINPPEEFARTMSKEDWQWSAGVLAEKLGFSDQRMALVLHQKNGRQHVHAVFERYNQETGKIVAIAHNYRKHQAAGWEIAQRFGLQSLPERNPRRDPMKEVLTRIWQETADAKTFIRQAKQQGYMISKGYDRKPFLVVDDTGRSFNLTRHLEGIKTSAIKERFKDTVLVEERKAVAFVRNQQSVINEHRQKKQEPDQRQEFLENLKQARTKQQSHKPRIH